MCDSAWVLTCDPGVDDAIALAVLAGCGDDVLRTVVAGAGNVDGPTAWRNTVGLAALFGLDVPVHVGSTTTCDGAPIHRPGDVHGTDGLAGLARLLPARPEASTMPAVPPGGAQSLQGQVVAIGPLTDVALAVRSGHALDRLVWMGGALLPGAADAPDARPAPDAVEFNAAADPAAVGDVLASDEIDIEVVPLDITRQVRLSSGDLARWTGGPPAIRLCAALAGSRLADGIVTLHDAVAVVAALEPDLFRWKSLHLRCPPAHDRPRGALVVDGSPGRSPNARVAVAVDAPAVVDVIVESVAALGR